MLEHCNQKMKEIVAVVGTDDEHDEIYEGVVGYECEVCGFMMDVNGEEIE